MTPSRQLRLRPQPRRYRSSSQPRATRSGTASSPASTAPVATSPVSASSQRNLARSSLGSCVRPGAARVGVLVDARWPVTERFVSEVRAAALTIGQQIEVLYASSGREIDAVFAGLSQKPVDALLVG